MLDTDWLTGCDHVPNPFVRWYTNMAATPLSFESLGIRSVDVLTEEF